MEAFNTLQGEGFHAGEAAYFIRLGGCDVGCHWCDVKESWDADAHPEESIDTIVSGAMQFSSKMVVITGGEPLMYDLSLLTSRLHDEGFQVHLETSGAHPLTGLRAWICFSPKKFKQPLDEFYEKASELKLVIYNRSDFEWAEDHAAKVNANCRLFLQPEWSRAEKIMPSIVDYIKANPKWRMSLQTHKFLNIP